MGAFVLQILDNNGSIIGTGFFCDPNGWVLTAAHVVAGQEMISVRDREMNTWPVEGLIPGELSSDVVLMKTSAHPRNYAQLADTDSDVSDSVIQVGHPFGVSQQIVSEGKVENLNGNGGTWVCSMSAMPGNSGSPVFNQEWELVGITSKGSYFTNSKKDSDPARTWVVPLRELRKLFEAAKKSQLFQPVAMSKEWEEKSSFWNREEAKRSLALLQARTFLYESYQDRDPQKAAAIIVTEAERGSSEAINLLGLITHQGEGVPKDPEKAFELWRGLAEQGNADAQYNLGVCYKKGVGVTKNEMEAVKWYTRSAEQGNATAQCNLGVCYEKGQGITQDYKEAVKWYAKSAEQGNGMAQCNLGFCYEHGVGVGKDEKEAVRWYTKSAEQGNELAKKALEKFFSPVLVNIKELRDSKEKMVPGVLYYEDEGITQEDLETKKLHEALRKSAEQGDARAQFKLGVDYFTGVGAIQDYKEAAKWWTKAAEQGDADAQYRLGMFYRNGNGVTKDEKEAVRWWTKSAEQGNAEAKSSLEKLRLTKAAEQGDAAAQCDLGVFCLYKNTKYYHQEAVKWFTKAAEQGNAKAQYFLGECHLEGIGVEKDEKEAVNWYTKSAEQGNAVAQFDLGVCYDNGRGVGKDEKQAVKWYTKAAEQGYAKAQSNLGVCYETGRGVGKDEKQAVKWYTKSAEQGVAPAQYNLGLCYDNGRGVGKDEKQAVKWFTKSAEQGVAPAQYNLGDCYYTGTGVGKDEKEAVRWWTKSAEQGLEEAKRKLEELKSK